MSSYTADCGGCLHTHDLQVTVTCWSLLCLRSAIMARDVPFEGRIATVATMTTLLCSWRVQCDQGHPPVHEGAGPP